MRHMAIAMALTVLGGCGNYSNEDIEFQLALPEKDELEVRIPQAQIVADAAEYYQTTRNLVRAFDALKSGILGIVDHVRLYPATTRAPNQRTWGPFPHEKQRDWLVRIVMRKVVDAGTPVRFEYTIGLRRRTASQNDDWIPLLWGNYLPGGGALRSNGEIFIKTGAARAAGHVVDDPADPDDLNDLDELHLAYQTKGFPTTVDVTISNLSTIERAAGTSTYSYREEANGQGSMRFTYDVAFAPAIERIELYSRWLSTGAGRGDSRVVKGTWTGLGGTDCWGSDTRPTFVHRSWGDDKQPNRGDAATCVFPDP